MKVLRVAGALLALGLLGAVMGQLAGLFEAKIPIAAVAAAEPAGDRPHAVVEVREEPVVEQAPGSVRAKTQTAIGALISAQVRTVAVNSGDEVRTGDLLVELDDREVRARLRQAQGSIDIARARFVRAEQDHARVLAIRTQEPGAVSQGELESRVAELAAATAEVGRAEQVVVEARTALSHATIIAPFSGRVIDRFADPGDTAAPGVELVRMYDPGSLRLEASVRESLATRLRRGEALVARIDAIDREVPVSVAEIVPAADPGSRSFVVKTTLPVDENLYPGMFARLLIPTGAARRLYVPRAAVSRVGQLEFVEVLTATGVVRRYVRTGHREGENRIEILSGLEAGERVAVGE